VCPFLRSVDQLFSLDLKVLFGKSVHLKKQSFEAKNVDAGFANMVFVAQRDHIKIAAPLTLSHTASRVMEQGRCFA
jgi:ribosomal protein S10